ncbi:MAG: NAD(P)/FAD-dependent oxidoreductase [Actinomycetota bacterium]
MNLPRPARVSWWMEEARGVLRPEPTPPLEGSIAADVVVLGGGYTGMWTAWFLKERDPSCDVVLLEADELCGSGPSGRNGGFCYGMWEDLEALVRFFGEADALRVARTAQRSVDEIEAWLAEHGVDAWFTRAGHLTVATSAAQDGAWSSLVAEADRLGVLDGRFVELDDDQVRARCLSPVFRGGLLQPENATLQPARLALGLRAALLERGVRIHESTAAVRFTEGPPVRVETDRGVTVSAERGVLGLGAWAASLPRFRRSIVPRGTYIVVTEPAPERLEEIGWTGGEGLADWRTALRYFRTTPDGRIAFGAASAAAGLGVGLGPRLRYDERSVAKLVDDVRRFFPSWSDLAIEAAWGGPMDVTGRHLPSFGTLPGGTLHYGLGYTGGGVGPCHLGGKILSALALGIEDEHTALPLVDLEMMRFPPEPFLSVGAAITQHAIVRKDEAEDRGRRTDPLTRFVAKLPRRMGYELGP